MPEKLIVVVGATGNQGGSVARRFLAADFHVRGITRDGDSAASRTLVSSGADMTQADLGDVDSLEEAFRGANVIFSVTNYWEYFLRPDCRAKAQELGISCRKYAYNVELRQWQNIVDAAATTVDTLFDNGFLASTLSHAGKCSGGNFKELYHFDAKADVFPGYNPDGTFTMAFTTSPDKPVPHLDPVGDMGNFTYAVSQMPPGKAYMAAGTTCTWPKFLMTWANVTGAKASYEQVSFEEMVEATADRETGIEVAHTLSYSSNPGYEGGVDLLTVADLANVGIDCSPTTWEKWVKKNDWSDVLNK